MRTPDTVHYSIHSSLGATHFNEGLIEGREKGEKEMGERERQMRERWLKKRERGEKDG